MQVQINETGAELELVAIDADTGCEYTRDLIGNCGGLLDGQFEQIEDTAVYCCDQATYDWWSGVISDYNDASDLVKEAKALGLWTDAHSDDYCRIECNDMDTHANLCVQFAQAVVDSGE